jgi:hypothetical protein
MENNHIASIYAVLDREEIWQMVANELLKRH